MPTRSEKTCGPFEGRIEPAGFNMATGWCRLCARILDFSITLPLVFLVVIGASAPIEFLLSRYDVPALAVIALDLVIWQAALLGAIVIHDTIALSVFGTTIGKAAMGLAVRRVAAGYLTIPQAARRTECLLRWNLYLIGFPILTAASVAMSSHRATRRGATEWDLQSESVVTARPLGVLRLTAGSAVAVLALVTTVVASWLAKADAKAEIRQAVIDDIRRERDGGDRPVQPTTIEGWTRVSAPGICEFQIPPTMELQGQPLRLLNDAFRGSVLRVTDAADRIVAQQAGLNAQAPQAQRQYVRFIVETRLGSRGDFPRIDQPLVVSAEEIAEFDADVRKTLAAETSQIVAKGMEMTVGNWEKARVTRINGMDCMLVGYTRSANGAPPARVRMYTFFNDDRTHLVTASYRVEQSELWAADLDRVIKTLTFHRR